MTDRAKEGLFSSLGNLVEGAAVLDLFAGSGSLGIEAMSRGAKSVVFVDLGKEAVAAAFMPVLRQTKYTDFNVTPDLTIPVSNDMVYQNGNYMEAATSGGKSQTEYGRYAAAIVKGADGQWRLGYIMAFSDSIVPVKK